MQQPLFEAFESQHSMEAPATDEMFSLFAFIHKDHPCYSETSLWTCCTISFLS